MGLPGLTVATFTAAVPLNMKWSRGKRVVEIAEDGPRGIPLAANTPFTVPNDLAAEFLEIHGANTFTVQRSVNANVATVETITRALIPGLTLQP